ncbi:putative disease resistance protein RGA4 [Spatholobus suberectus]|nr:putative disease resistance protein RGA4 [Spatholobus suberectus]
MQQPQVIAARVALSQEIRNLWASNLGLLRELTIRNCSKLTCLPTSLSLSSLESLSIDGCPDLEKRCQKETGEDWPKIAHIPHVGVPTYNVRAGRIL